ncbi:MAG: DUF4394 domain-containing protein [Longimicrobiales bacterium]
MTVDTVLGFITGDPNTANTPAIVATAYTFAAIGGTTSLLAIDANRDVITLSERGALRTIGTLPINASNDAGFDIAPDGAAFVTLPAVGSNRSNLYSVTGLPGSAQFTLAGQVRAVLRGIAIAT